MYEVLMIFFLNQLRKHMTHILRYGTFKIQVIQQQRQVNILDLNNRFVSKGYTTSF